MQRTSKHMGGKIALLIAAVLAAGLYLSGPDRRSEWYDRGLAWLRGSSADSTAVHWCPMDPEIVRPGEGMCPICNMALVPFEGGGAARDESVLTLTDRQIQQAGVRLDTVEVRDLIREIDTTGRLKVDPNKRTYVGLSYPGTSLIERLHVHSQGDSVIQGQVLLEIRNSDMTSLMEGYREALKSYEALKRDGRQDQTPAALMRLNTLKNRFVSYGLPAAQVNIIAAKGKNRFSEPLFPVISPEGGVLLSDPMIREGMYVREGASLFEIADLKRLWLYVDLYEHERPLVETGQRVEFSSLAAPDQVFETSIRYIEPLVQESTHTFRARARVAAAGGTLAPGMFLRTRIACDVPAVLSVPESAVLHSGRRDVTLISEGGGRFRPKLLKLGRRYLSMASREESELRPETRYHEVLEGLDPGDRVVVAGSFLLNAEAHFQGILEKMLAAEEARERAPELSAEDRVALDRALDLYTAIGEALVQDEARELAKLAQDLIEIASAVRERAGESVPLLGELLERLEQAAGGLVRAVSSEEVDLEVARLHFGSLSREIVAYLGAFAPESAATGEVFVFRCPMADDYGFDLWVQRDSELANPYMGQSMPECGMPAELP